MQFDINRVYTAVNADVLKVGSKIIVADDLSSLQVKVIDCDGGRWVETLASIWGTNSRDRFKTVEGGRFNLAYLVSEPEENKLKWIDLKIGDVIKKKGDSYKIMVVGIDDADAEQRIYNGLIWLSDEELEKWEKVENE